MAPVGMQLIHSLWTLAHTKGPTNHMSWRVRAWGYPAASRAVDIVQSNSVFWGKSADPRSLGSFQCFWATNVFLAHWAIKCGLPKLCFCEALYCQPKPQF